MVKSKGEQEAYSAGTQKSGMYKLSGDACERKNLDFYEDFAENATKIYIFSISRFCLRVRNSRPEGHLHNGFGEVPV